MRTLLSALILGLLAAQAAAQAPAPVPARPAAPPATSTPAAPSSVAPPRPAATTTPQAAPAATARVDVNLATEEELQTLPGIGAARSAAIIQHRPYRSVDEVASKASVPAGVLTQLRDRLTATVINVNTATRQEMIAVLPGIGEARADAIIRGRPYANAQEIVSKAGVPQAVFDRIRAALVTR